MAFNKDAAELGVFPAIAVLILFGIASAMGFTNFLVVAAGAVGFFLSFYALCYFIGRVIQIWKARPNVGKRP